MKANSIEELFGTLQQSVVEEWRKHLKTSKYSKHMALDEFYKEMPEKIDKLIEDYIGAHEKLNDYKNVFTADSMNALEYLEALLDLCKQGRKDFLEGESELESDMDDIIGFIDGVIYKVRELKENKIVVSKSLVEMLNESLNEAKQYISRADFDKLPVGTVVSGGGYRFVKKGKTNYWMELSAYGKANEIGRARLDKDVFNLVTYFKDFEIEK